MIGLVVDTNVLVSANLKADGLEAVVVALAFNGKVRMYVSEPILAEYERVLRYPHLRFRPQEVTRIMTLLRESSVVVQPRRIVTVSRDETDNRFVECAEAADADFLVTGNKRHFPKVWEKTRVVNARELLGLIGPSFLR
jgi:putative PIN family toxin of toxin-antitoxin system